MKSERRLYHNMKIFDGIAETLQDRNIIITHKDRIEHISDTSEMNQYKDCENIDLKGRILLPGFIDAHIHVTVPFMMKVTPKGLFQMNKQVAKNIENCVKYGVTTIRDMASFPKKIIKWRKRIESGQVAGPRILTALSFITSPKGIPEMAPTLKPIEALITGGQFVERLTTPEEIITVANRLVDSGADLLKTQYEENSFLFHGKLPNLSDDCLEALVRVGKKRDVNVAMHHFERNGFLKGINVGVNTLEHCATDELKDEDIERFVGQKMAIIPTVKALGDYLEIDEILDFLRTKGSEDLLSEPLRQSIEGIEMFSKKPYPPKDYENQFYPDVEFFKRTHPIVLRNVERIMKMGGTIGVGTDCCGTGMSFFGHYWKELKWLTSAGFTNADALKAATAVNAAIIGMADSIGTIEPSKYADFTIIEGDPLENVENVKNVKMVVKGGNVIYNNL